MSEFRIVKCKKCDAALTEMKGEKLTSCVQCGYSFNMTNSKNKQPHAITRKIKESPEFKRYLNKIRSKGNSAFEVSAQPSAETTSSTTRAKRTKKATTPLPSKKKSNPIGTIIVWIIIFNIVRSIFFN